MITNIVKYFFGGTDTSNEWTSGSLNYAGITYESTAGNSHYYMSGIKFKVETESTRLHFHLGLRLSKTTATNPGELKWKIFSFTSSTPHGNISPTTVKDAFAIDSGTLTATSDSDYKWNDVTTKLLPVGSYFLCFYRESGTSTYYFSLGEHHMESIGNTFEGTSNKCYIYNGSAWVPAYPIVYTPSGWQEASPQIYNSGWK